MQIADSVAGRRRIVRHVGSARDEAELGLLMEEAPGLDGHDRGAKAWPGRSATPGSR